MSPHSGCPGGTLPLSDLDIDLSQTLAWNNTDRDITIPGTCVPCQQLLRGKKTLNADLTIFLTLIQKDILFLAQESYEKTSTSDLDLSSKAAVIRKTKCPLTNGFLMALCSQSQLRGNMKQFAKKSLLRFQLFQNIALNEVLFLGGESKTRVRLLSLTYSCQQTCFIWRLKPKVWEFESMISLMLDGTF